MMLQSDDNYAYCINERKLCLRELDLLDQCHKSTKDLWSVGHELLSSKFERIDDILELSACRYSYDLVVELVISSEQVSENLVH